MLMKTVCYLPPTHVYMNMSALLKNIYKHLVLFFISVIIHRKIMRIMQNKILNNFENYIYCSGYVNFKQRDYMLQYIYMCLLHIYIFLLIFFLINRM